MKTSKILIGKTKHILSKVKEDEELHHVLTQGFDSMQDKQVPDWPFTITSCFPDGTPSYFACDFEHRMVVVTFTSFKLNDGRAVITFWCTNQRGIIIPAATSRIAIYPFRKTDMKDLKLISAKAKTVFKRVLQLLPDKYKIIDFINSIKTINL